MTLSTFLPYVHVHAKGKYPIVENGMHQTVNFLQAFSAQAVLRRKQLTRTQL
jgi:hypothetical protein